MFKPVYTPSQPSFKVSQKAQKRIRQAAVFVASLQQKGFKGDWPDVDAGQRQRLEVLLAHPDIQVIGQTAIYLSGSIHIQEKWAETLWALIIDNLERRGKDGSPLGLDVLTRLREEQPEGWPAKVAYNEQEQTEILTNWIKQHSQNSAEEIAECLGALHSNKAYNIFLSQLDISTPDAARQKIAVLWRDAFRHVSWEGLGQNQTLTEGSREVMLDLAILGLSQGYYTTRRGLEVLEICLARGLKIDAHLEAKFLNWEAAAAHILDGQIDRGNEDRAASLVAKSPWPKRLPNLWRAMVRDAEWDLLMTLSISCPAGGFETWWGQVQALQGAQYGPDGLSEALRSLPPEVAREIDKKTFQELLGHTDKEIRLAGTRLAGLKGGGGRAR